MKGELKKERLLKRERLPHINLANALQFQETIVFKKVSHLLKHANAAVILPRCTVSNGASSYMPKRNNDIADIHNQVGSDKWQILGSSWAIATCESPSTFMFWDMNPCEDKQHKPRHRWPFWCVDWGFKMHICVNDCKWKFKFLCQVSVRLSMKRKRYLPHRQF